MKFSLHLVIFALCIVLAAFSSFAQLTANRSGRLDRTYAQDGVGNYLAQTFFGNSITLDEGSLIQIGTFQEGYSTSRFVVDLRKFTANGEPDPAFGTNGRRTYPLGNDAGGVAIARQNDGKYLIAGGINPTTAFEELDFLVFRVLPNGDLDTSFGENGVFIKNFLTPIQGEATIDSIDIIHILADGKILVTGTSTRCCQAEKVSHSRALKLNPNGSIDSSFASDGLSETNIGYGQYFIAGMTNSTSAIDLSGRLVVGVVPYFEPGSGTNFGCKILRYLPNGSLDPSFGQKGIRILTPGQMSGCPDFAFLPDGKILVLTGWTVMRLNEDGSIDATFAAGGTLFTGQYVRLGDMFVSENGKIYLAGTQQVPLPSGGVAEYAIIKGFHSNGMPDLRFGQGGRVGQLALNEEMSAFRKLHPTPYGLVATGSYRDGAPFFHFRLARFTFVP